MNLARQIVEFLENNDLSKTNKINWVQDRLNDLGKEILDNIIEHSKL